MKNIRKIILSFFTFILVLNLSACQNSTKKASENVHAFTTELRDAKNLEYVSQVYRKYLNTQEEHKIYRSEMITRQGKIQFNPQIYLEAYNERKADYVNQYDQKTFFDEALITIGAPYRLDHGEQIYSPSEGVTYTGYVNKQKQLEWKPTQDWKYGKVKEDPKLGHNEEFLKLYETYAEQFIRTEDNQFVYLEFKGDVKDNLDLVGAFHSSVFKSNMFTDERDYITGVDIQIKLVMEKVEDGDKKLVPSEAKIILTTTSENTEKKWNATSEDHFEFYYRNFNKVGDIEKPEGVTLQ